MKKFEQFRKDELFGARIHKFQKLMPYKIRDILLVSSEYDSYLFEEEGRLYELLRQEYQMLNLNFAPELTHVSTGSEALEQLKQKNTYDLIISTLHIEDMHTVDFANAVRSAGVSTPIVLLAYDNRERKELVLNYDTSIFERIFIWQGDFKLLIGIIKYVEDKMNVDNDTRIVGVQSIILIEDNVKFYSSYLPIIYTEILKHSQRLISESLNLTHKYIRMRARPKILLCTTYEEAWEYFEKYSEFILGVISDINFKHNGVKDPEAGLKFAQAVKRTHADIPVLLQSSNPDFMTKARQMNVSFLLKGSPTLLHDLQHFMISNFGFGDFVFYTQDGREVGQASDLKTLEEQLRIVPGESISFHAERNHFSNWLKARTEFWLAHKLRPRKITDFEGVEELRNDLISSIRQYLEIRSRGVITDFSKYSFDVRNSFARIGGGSIGGKARGLGFVNNLIVNYDLRDRFPGIEIFVPSAVVIATDLFDMFLEENNLFGFALSCEDDEKITRRFLEAGNISQELVDKLTEFLDIVHEPLAIRSSSLLEDSQFQPFAGVYQTYMIPNNDPDPAVRLKELLNSIKRVYASTFYRSSKDYMKATAYRLEEEKMAVIIQKMVGAPRSERFYPDFSGVAKSYNFYPVKPQKSSDGIAMVALGLGKMVVEGGNSVRFSPKYPRHLPQFFSTKETVRNAQQEFYALELNSSLKDKTTQSEDILVKKHGLEKAEKDGPLLYSGSTYSAENDFVYDGLSRPGTRIVTMAPILKHKLFPLAEILDLVLDIGRWGMGTQIEIEFAVNMDVPKGYPREFGLLQMRPMVLSSEIEELNVNNYSDSDLIVQSQIVLGNGSIRDIFDIIVVDIDEYDRSKSREAAHQVGMLNSRLVNEKKPYILIGVGRWGTMDQWLGIPVTWDQISGAVAIVESGFRDFSVTPSQGSHFFQNLTSFRIAYFTVNSFMKEGFIDWQWLKEQPVYEDMGIAKHLRFDQPLSVKINGHLSKGIILKPGI